MAKGSRRPKSLLLAATQFLCFGQYLLYKGGNTYSLNSCEVVEAFYNIRTDLDKLKYASFITKVISDVTTENQNTYRVLQLFLNTLYMISETDKDLSLIKSVFIFRLMSIIGYRPIIDECASCKTKEDLIMFSFKDNGLKCKTCGKQDKGAIQILPTTVDAIKYIILANPKKIFSFEIPKESIKELDLISKIYLTEKLEKEYKL